MHNLSTSNNEGSRTNFNVRQRVRQDIKGYSAKTEIIMDSEVEEVSFLPGEFFPPLLYDDNFNHLSYRIPGE